MACVISLALSGAASRMLTTCTAPPVGLAGAVMIGAVAGAVISSGWLMLSLTVLALKSTTKRTIVLSFGTFSATLPPSFSKPAP